MNSTTHQIIAVFILLIGAPLVLAQDSMKPFSSDGWYSWRVGSVEHNNEWCCYRWNAGHPTQAGCALDGGDHGQSIINSEPDRERSNELQIYARLDKGQIDRLRVLSPTCPVSSDVPWTDLGSIGAPQSLRWIESLNSEARRESSDRVMAIAAHAGEEARDRLIDIALQGSGTKQREAAIFWMGQLRIDETRDVLLELMVNDDNRKIREQAIFSYAQSPADDRLEVLIGVIENQQVALHDRKKALFWLAQSEDGRGVDYIQDLLLSH